MRAFIVGNGPSLQDTNLDLIRGETSFAVNRIHLHYEQTSWRPTHYVRAENADLKSAARYHDEVRLHLDMGCEVWANKWFTLGTDMTNKVHTIVSCWHYTNHYYDAEAPHVWHLPKLCLFGSSVNVAIQIAAMKGYKPLYLLGCDLNYRDGAPSHMHPDYERGIEDELRPARFANLDTLAAHMVAARSSPSKIYNCTPKGLLHDLGVYENKRLEDVCRESS
jgi:hypothetical protein